VKRILLLLTILLLVGCSKNDKTEDSKIDITMSNSEIILDDNEELLSVNVTFENKTSSKQSIKYFLQITNPSGGKIDETSNYGGSDACKYIFNDELNSKDTVSCKAVFIFSDPGEYTVSVYEGGSYDPVVMTSKKVKINNNGEIE
jgi:hypothetical protein